MKVRRSTLKDQIIVRTATGGGSYGQTLASAVRTYCQLDETRRLVRSSSGEETVSEATLVLHPRSWVQALDDSVIVADPMDVFTEDSEVTINGRVSKVISAKRLTMRGYTVAVEVVCE